MVPFLLTFHLTETYGEVKQVSYISSEGLEKYLIVNIPS